LCPSGFTVKWDVLGFYITFARQGSGCTHHKNHLKGNLSKLSLPMQLIPEKEKEILQSMSNACIGSTLERNYVFSKLGRYITKAQTAYFTSEPSRPLAEGMNKSDTDSLLEFFKKTKEISYHTLWDVPGHSGGAALLSSVNVVCEKVVSKINHTNGPEFLEPRESAIIS
jgi:hypothetical protein